VCGASGSIAAITQVHCLCDVSYCLAMDQERLQENFSRTDVRTVIKFNVLLDKSALEGYKSLKEGLGTHAPSHETVRRWVNLIKNGREQTDDAPRSGAPTMATDELHVNQVKFVLKVRAVFHARQLLQKSESREQVFTVSSPTAWVREKFVQSGIHTCSTMTKEPCVSSR
jgi:hypothetical protein